MPNQYYSLIFMYFQSAFYQPNELQLFTHQYFNFYNTILCFDTICFRKLESKSLSN